MQINNLLVSILVSWCSGSTERSERFGEGSNPLETVYNSIEFMLCKKLIVNISKNVKTPL